MMYRHPSAQVHGAKVQNNYGLCKIFAKIHKKNRSKANLGLSKNTAKTWQKMKLCATMVRPLGYMRPNFGLSLLLMVLPSNGL